LGHSRATETFCIHGEYYIIDVGMGMAIVVGMIVAIVEGRGIVIEDGDVMFVRFNV